MTGKGTQMEENKIDTAEVENTAEADEGAKKKKKCCATSQKEQIESLKAEIETLKAEKEQSEKERDDKYLRLAAEYDNFRRRSREERIAAYDGAMADTVGQLLPILDNLERAESFSDAEKVKEGLVMIAKSVEGVLLALGIEKYGEAGETFDPNLHNAVMHEENEEMGEGIITDVFQKGYKKGNKIIRFAMVKTVN
jgi:molecular chaperone GrpE